jgi:hypothetical protein
MAVERTREPFNIEDSIGDDPEELEIEIVNPRSRGYHG